MTGNTIQVAETTEEIVQLLTTVCESDRLLFTYRNGQQTHTEAIMDSFHTGYDTDSATERGVVLWFRNVERDDEGHPPHGKVHYFPPHEPALKQHPSVYGDAGDPPSTRG